jgi:heat shock protein HspQ
MTNAPDRSALPPAIAAAPLVAHARFRIGDMVRHRLHGFRGLVFDVDPVFANSEEWYSAIPAEMRPEREQPFYHLFAENEEGSYVAYVSQQNLEGAQDAEPVDHPAVEHFFLRRPDGTYRLRSERLQ